MIYFMAKLYTKIIVKNVAAFFNLDKYFKLKTVLNVGQQNKIKQ